jgi:hypothetical protein
MTHRYTGGCACGAIRYEKPGDTVAELHCQCQHCQKRSGTGHSTFLVFPARSDFIVTGEVRTWNIAGDSGNEKVNAFCPVCGTPVFVTFVAMPEMLAIHAGSLDDPGQSNPGIVTYATRAQAWDAIDPGLQAFAKMPPG